MLEEGGGDPAFPLRALHLDEPPAGTAHLEELHDVALGHGDLAAADGAVVRQGHVPPALARVLREGIRVLILAHRVL